MEELLTADQAVKYARDAVLPFTESRLRVALEAAAPKYAALVQRIDKKDAFYFIVPFAIDSKETARVILDAVGGKLKQISGITESDQSLPPHVTPERALDRMLAARTTSKIKKWDFEFRKALVGQHPVLVWKPCRQSPSPFFPFYQFSVGNSLVYLRVDGELFDGLKTGPA